MEIVKQLNNNIVIAADGQGREVILMGKGIGFGKKPGFEVDPAQAERQFWGFPSDQYGQQLAELLERIPPEHLAIGMQIVEHVREKIQKPLNGRLVLMISDHVSFALERKERGLELNNALLWETRKFYPEEYKMGLAALDIIEAETGVRLAEDEAGFLAMHIVNAQYGSGDPVAQDLIRLIQDVVNLVRYTYGIDLDEESLDYIRFVTHLKFFLARIFSKTTYEQSSELYGIVSVMYVKAAACVRKIADYIQQKSGYSLSQEEQAYLIIHVEKLTR